LDLEDEGIPNQQINIVLTMAITPYKGSIPLIELTTIGVYSLSDIDPSVEEFQVKQGLTPSKPLFTLKMTPKPLKYF